MHSSGFLRNGSTAPTGLDAQRAAIEHFAANESLVIIAEYVEAETGKGCDALDRRPRLAAVLATAFAGSDEGGRRAAAIYTLIATAKLNNIDPQAWLADVPARLPDHPAKRIHNLLPWSWRPHNVARAA